MDRETTTIVVGALVGVIGLLVWFVKNKGWSKGSRSNGNGKSAASMFAAKLDDDKMRDQIADLHRDRSEPTLLLRSMDASLTIIKDRLPRQSSEPRGA